MTARPNLPDPSDFPAERAELAAAILEYGVAAKSAERARAERWDAFRFLVDREKALVAQGWSKVDPFIDVLELRIAHGPLTYKLQVIPRLLDAGPAYEARAIVYYGHAQVETTDISRAASLADAAHMARAWAEAHRAQPLGAP